VSQLWARSSDLRLIKTGTRVDDAVIWLTGARVKGRPIGEQDGVIVEFKWKGEDVAIRGRRLAGWTDGILSGEVRTIYVDPNDSTNYTARTEPPPMGRLLIGPMLLCAFAAVLLALSIVKRRGVLAIWRNGEAREAAVVETKQTALAPRSRLVRCALTAGNDRRVINVYVPHRAGNPQPGETIWILMPTGRPEKAVAAASFVVTGA